MQNEQLNSYLEDLAKDYGYEAVNLMILTKLGFPVPPLFGDKGSGMQRTSNHIRTNMVKIMG